MEVISPLYVWVICEVWNFYIKAEALMKQIDILFLRIELTGVEDETKGHNKSQSVLEKGFYIQWRSICDRGQQYTELQGEKLLCSK